MSLPTPQTDPNGLAATVIVFVGVVFTAVDPSGALGTRWTSTIVTGIAIAGLLWARVKAWSPAKAEERAKTAEAMVYAQAAETAVAVEHRNTEAQKSPRPLRARPRGDPPH